jgi:hypothetical protein
MRTDCKGPSPLPNHPLATRCPLGKFGGYPSIRRCKRCWSGEEEAAIPGATRRCPRAKSNGCRKPWTCALTGKECPHPHSAACPLRLEAAILDGIAGRRPVVPTLTGPEPSHGPSSERNQTVPSERPAPARPQPQGLL